MSCFGQVRSSTYKKLGTVLRAGQGFPLVSQRPNCKTLWSRASKMPWLHHRLEPESIFFRMCCIVNVGWKIYKIVCNSIYMYISSWWVSSHLKNIMETRLFVEGVWDSHSYFLRLLPSLRRQMIMSLPVPLLGNDETEWFGHWGIRLMIWLQMNHVALMKMNTYANTGHSPQDFIFTHYSKICYRTYHYILLKSMDAICYQHVTFDYFDERLLSIHTMSGMSFWTEQR